MDALFTLINEVFNNPPLLRGLVVFSVLFFVFGIASVPYLVCKIPEDYFLREQRNWRDSYLRFGPAFLIVILGKNILAVILLLSGLLMLFLPGQGLLSMFLGIVLLDFPRKYQLERWLIRKPALNRSLNWIRNKKGHKTY
mgnify:FL=1